MYFSQYVAVAQWIRPWLRIREAPGSNPRLGLFITEFSVGTFAWRITQPLPGPQANFPAVYTG